MATKRKQPVSVETLTHPEATRANIPTAEYQPVVGPRVSDSVAVSYLTYLRDRLTVARDLLTESGSIFVQTRDENVHRVRAVMDEVPPVSPRAPSTDPRAAALR